MICYRDLLGYKVCCAEDSDSQLVDRLRKVFEYENSEEERLVRRRRDSR